MSKEKTLVAAVCPKCGANLELDNSLEVAYCMYCRAKVIINSSTKKVKLDKSKDLENLYTLARRAKENNNAEDALKYYEKILVEDPNNWEPTFYKTYYRALNCKVGEIPTVITNINNCLETIFDLIKENCDKDEIESVVQELIDYTLDVRTRLYTSANVQLRSISLTTSLLLMDTHDESVRACINTLYNLGDLIEKEFSRNSEIKEKAVLPWKNAIIMNTKSKISLINTKVDLKDVEKTIEEYFEKIKKYEPEYKLPESPTKKLNSITQRVVDLIGYIVLGIIGVFGLVIVFMLIFNI